jgi:hypothetical protein
MSNECVFPRDHLPSYDRLASRRQSPSTRTERLVQYPSVLDLGEVDDSVRFDLYVIIWNGRQKNFRSLFTERLRRETVERACPVDLSLTFV